MAFGGFKEDFQFNREISHKIDYCAFSGRWCQLAL